MSSTKKNKQRTKSSSVYTQKHFESDSGMLTKIWGSAMWHYLHTMSFNYPVQPTNIQKKQYRDFVLSLQNVLPCAKCRKNLKNNLKTHPLVMKHLESRDSFSRYIFNLHEVVNTMLNKKSGLTYEQVRERYENFRARCLKDPKTGELSEPIKPIKKGVVTSEMGCIEPVHGVKSRCILKIVPQTEKCESLIVDKQCVSKKAQAVCRTMKKQHK